MVGEDILAFAAAFKKVRGYEPRRVYITNGELIDILTEQILLRQQRCLPSLTLVGSPFGEMEYGPYRVETHKMALQIREWDLLSPS